MKESCHSLRQITFLRSPFMAIFVVFRILMCVAAGRVVEIVSGFDLDYAAAIFLVMATWPIDVRVSRWEKKSSPWQRRKSQSE